MSLIQKFDQDIKQAMIAKDSTKLEVLRFLKSAVKYAAIEKTSGDLTDAEIMQVLQKQIKQRRESIAQFANGGREDLASKEKLELAVLESYMPKQVSDEELNSILDEIIKSSGANSKKDFGRVMKLCVEKLGAQADNKRISESLGKKLQ